MAQHQLAPSAMATRRVAMAGAGALGVLGMSTAGAVIASWDALVRVRAPATSPPATVTAVEPPRVPGASTTITLRGPGADEAGWTALIARDGRLMAGPPERTESGWRRQCAPLPGVPEPLLDAGAAVEVSANAWDDCEDPFGLGATTSSLDTAIGPLTVTSAGPDDARSAVVFVHGRAGTRATGWWLAPTCVDAGWRVVMPAYRNDPDSPRTGHYLLGGEWLDLAAVLGRLGEQGVQRVVLVGWSMGGNICASYLRHRQRSPRRFADHPEPVGLVLDAAALDWGHVLRHIARHRRLPARLAPLVMAYGQLARRVDWGDLNHLAGADHLALPVLAMHGDADDVVPAELSEMLAATLPDARLEVFAGAGHCRSLHHDPPRYLGALRGLLDAVRPVAAAA